MLIALHSANRMFEYCAAVIMFQVGLGVVLVPALMQAEVAGTFGVFQEWGLSFSNAALMLIAIGIARGLALYANGYWGEYGCYARAIGCGLGLIIWLQFLGGALQMLLVKQQLFIVTFVWEALAVFEFFSLCRALLDSHQFILLRKARESHVARAS